MGHASAVDFLTEVERSAHLRIVFVGPEIEDEAIRWLRRHDERPYSFVDATSFLVMRDLKISNALTFDADFTAAGFHQVSL